MVYRRINRISMRTRLVPLRRPAAYFRQRLKTSRIARGARAVFTPQTTNVRKQGYNR